MSSTGQKAVLIGGQVELQPILDGASPHPLDLESFRNYCKKRLVEENLDFWLLVERTFKTCKDPVAYCHLVDLIIHSHITDSSLREINIPIRLKKETLGTSLRAKKVAMDQGLMDTTVFDNAQKHVFDMLNTDVLPGFKQMILVNQRLNLAAADALWWKKKPTLREFFSFPNPINSAESRLHYFLTCLWLVAGTLYFHYTRQVWVFIPMFYGFVARCICGPRLDPQAFLVLFVLRPFFEDRLGLIKTEFVPGPPKRFGQFVGTTFCITTIVLLVLTNYTNDATLSAAYAVIAIFFFAAFLGCVFDFCLACEMFYIGMKLGIIPEHVCRECSINYLSGDNLKKASEKKDEEAARSF